MYHYVRSSMLPVTIGAQRGTSPVQSMLVHLRANCAGCELFEEHNRIVDVYRIATPEVVGYVVGWRTGEAEILPKTPACRPFNKVKWF